jgi:hypothetical protein
MKRIVWGLIAIVVFGTTVQAQPTNSIRGTIRDAETKSPLIGASVLLPEENKGAVTDGDGRFITAIAKKNDSIVLISLMRKIIMCHVIYY